MAKGTVNKVILIGRIGMQPELKYTTSNMPIMRLSLATNDRYKEKHSDQFVDTTEWHRVSVFGKQAENISTYCNKGDLLYIEGRIKTTKYEDKNTGQERYATEIAAIQTQMIGSKTQSPVPDYVPEHVAMPSANKIPAQANANVNQQAAQYHAAKNGDRPTLAEINNDNLDELPF